MNDKDLIVLEEIVTLKGKCLLNSRCQQCPLISHCFPKYLQGGTSEHRQKSRLNLALKTLTDHFILTDD